MHLPRLWSYIRFECSWCRPFDVSRFRDSIFIFGEKLHVYFVICTFHFTKFIISLSLPLLLCYYIDTLPANIWRSHDWCWYVSSSARCFGYHSSQRIRWYSDSMIMTHKQTIKIMNRFDLITIEIRVHFNCESWFFCGTNGQMANGSYRAIALTQWLWLEMYLP